MPWKIKKRGSMYQVIKESTGKVLHSYASKTKALKYLRALYASERR